MTMALSIAQISLTIVKARSSGEKTKTITGLSAFFDGRKWLGRFNGRGQSDIVG